MKPNNKLNKALIEALRDKPEPLHEAQWDKLYAELHKEKKRRFIWIFFVWGLVGVGLVSAYLLWNSFSGADSTKHQATIPVSEAQVNRDSDIQNNSIQQNSVPSYTNSDIDNSVNSNDANIASVGTQSSPINNKSKNTTPKRLYKHNPDELHYPEAVITRHDENQNKTFNELIPSVSSNISKASDSVLPVKNNFKPELNPGLSTIIMPDKNLSQTTSDNQAEKDSTENASKGNENLSDIKTSDTVNIIALKVDDKKDDDKDKKKDDKKDDDKSNLSNGKFVFGLSYGLNLVNTKVTRLQGEEYMHKDTREIFENSNSNQRGSFVNLSFEYKFMNFGLRLNSGLQYRSIQNTVDFKYKLREVAFRNADNSVSFYIPVPDSSAMKFDVNTTQKFRFLTLPVQLSYAWPIGNKYELCLNAGLNLSSMIEASGQGFDINNLEVKDINSLIKQKFTLGYTGGFQISRQIINRWWLGIETNFSAINMAYKMGDGGIKSRISNQSINLQLRFKL